MPWETVFSLANLWVLPFWIMLAFGPRSLLTGRVILLGGIAPLAIVYAVILPLIMTGAVDAVGPESGPVDFTTLAGIMALFDSKGGTTIGWIHYLAFDLFVGLWVARNSDRYGFGRLVQIPILFFVLMAGPLGLALYLLLRLTVKNPPENAELPS